MASVPLEEVIRVAELEALLWAELVNHVQMLVAQFRGLPFSINGTRDQWAELVEDLRSLQHRAERVTAFFKGIRTYSPANTEIPAEFLDIGDVEVGARVGQEARKLKRQLGILGRCRSGRK